MVIWQIVLLVSVTLTELTVTRATTDHRRDKRQGRHRQGGRVAVKIGGLFDRVDSLEETIFKLAVEQINRDPLLLPYNHLTLKAETIEDDTSFHTAKAVCTLLRDGIVGMFGPQSSTGAAHAQSLCDRFDIPHIETRWDYRTRQEKYAVNLCPHPDTLGQAYVNLVDDRGWDNYALLYDAEVGLFKLQTLIRASELAKRNVTLRQLPDDDFRPLLKTLQREFVIRNFIVDSDTTKTLEILRQAEQIGMTQYDYSYILTTLDLQAEHMNEYRHGEANLFAFRMVDPTKPEVQQVSRELDQMMQSLDTRRQSPNPESSTFHSAPFTATTEQALVFDAVRLFSQALTDNSELVDDVEALNCDQDEGWTGGSTLLNDMKATKPFHGLSGLVQFNNSGFRTDISLDLMKVMEEGWTKVGTWEYARFTTNSRITWLNLTKPKVTEEAPKNLDLLPLRQRDLRVTMILKPPFCMLKQAEETKEGNEQYEGYCVDLVNELSLLLGFEYSIHLAHGTYPHMLDELKHDTTDMVVADVSVTTERQVEYDFTMPFMNLGISILFVPPQAKPPSLFSFMSPFAFEVWVYMAFSFFGVSLVLFIVARIAPVEWDNPLPCITDPDKLQNQFKYSNSIWFTLGSIMQQGSDLAPKAVSTRIIAGIWWFFTLIMVSSYTANLATFLIVEDLDDSINGLDDLKNQHKIEYGCYSGGTTKDYFKNSNDSDLRKMYDNMVKTNELKASNEDGIEAVREKKGKYAFFIESTSIEYVMERKCNLTQLGGLLDSKGFGVALKKDSPYLNLFNGGILRFQEDGRLDEFKRKWWKEQRKENAEQCQTKSVSDSVSALKLANVGGVFVVLVVGCIVAVFITCLEIYFNSKSRRPEVPLGPGESRCRNILKDLQFALQCRGNVKPVRKKSRQSLANSKEELGSTPSMKFL